MDCTLSIIIAGATFRWSDQRHLGSHYSRMLQSVSRGLAGGIPLGISDRRRSISLGCDDQLEIVRAAIILDHGLDQCCGMDCSGRFGGFAGKSVDCWGDFFYAVGLYTAEVASVFDLYWIQFGGVLLECVWKSIAAVGNERSFYLVYQRIRHHLYYGIGVCIAELLPRELCFSRFYQSVGLARWHCLAAGASTGWTWVDGF